MERARCARRTRGLLALAIAGLALAGPRAQALDIILNYVEEVRPSYDPDGTELMRISRAAADYWEGRILDTHTLTIDIHWGGGSGGSSGPTQFSGNRPVHGFIRSGSEESWYFDPTPFNDSEYNMTNWRYKDLTAQEKADYYRGVVPANLDAGQHGWVRDGAPAGAFNADLYQVMLHEIGHQLGIPWGVDGSPEMNDGDFDLVPSMLNGAAAAVRCPVNDEGGYNTGHLANLHTLMQPWYAAGERKLPSATDLLVGAAMSGWTQINLERTTFIGNAGQTNWNNKTYWLANSMPGLTDHAIIGHGGLCTISAPAVARELVVDDGSTLSILAGGDLQTTDLVISGGSFEVSAGSAQVSGVLAMDDILRSSGGLIVAETLNVGDTGNGVAYVSATGAITATTMNVGRAGVGDVRQSGGSVAVPVELVLGDEVNSVGMYDLTGGILYAQKVIVGGSGTGTMSMSAGAHEFGNSLVLGDLAGSAGTLTIGGTADLTVPMVTVGRLGRGSVIQSGGIHRVGVYLTIGQTSQTPLSYYELSGGTLRAPGENIQNGRFKQLGGTHVVTGTLSMEYAEYQMLGGSLSANAITAGSSSFSDTAFTQDAGTIDVSEELLVGSNGGAANWTQNGGSLLVPRLKVGGGGPASFSQAGGTAIITEALTVGTASGSLAEALVSGTASMIAPADAVGAGGNGKLTVDGGTLSITGTMALGTTSGKTGTFELKSGSASAASVHVGDGGTGSYALRGGAHTVTGDFSMARTSASGASATITGGTLDVKNGRIIVGQMKAATFAQSAGTVIANEFILSAGSAFPTLTTASSTLRFNTFTGLPAAFDYKGTLQIGHTGGSGSGSMSLPPACGGYAGNLDVGYSAPGTLDQPAGTDLTIEHVLDLGETPAGQGTYNMNGGYLTASEMLRVGNAGQGVFNHVAGTANAGAALILGNATGSSGTYNLGAAGGSPTARSVNQYIGAYGVGVFNHVAGSNRVTETLFLGAYYDGDGTYNLEGGTVYAATIDIGASGAGRFNWSGGGITADSIIIRDNGVLAVSGDRWCYRAINCSGGALEMAGHDLSLNGEAATFNLSSGQVTTANLYVGRSQGAVFTHTGGTNSASESIRIADDSGSTGTYDLQGGTLSTPALHIGQGGTGQLNWTGGSLAANLIAVGPGGTLSVGQSWGLGGTLRVEGGTVSLPLRESLRIGGIFSAGTASVSAGHLNTDTLLIGGTRSGTLDISGGTVVAHALTAGADSRSTGTINLTGGTLSIPTALQRTVTIGAAGGGTLNLGDASGTGQITQTGLSFGVAMVVRSDAAGAGALRGWGQPALTGGLTNNGRIIAAGFGRERDLDLSNFSAVLNSIENTSANGWFAEDHGRLALPSVPFAAGTSTANWGEAAADTSIDLVNSARITLNAVVTGGSMSMTLLSPDHWDVPLGTGGKIVGLWNAQMGKLKASSAGITLRYDDARVGTLGVDESSLRLYRFTQGDWVDVTGSVDVANKRITSSSLGSLGMLAVGADVGIANQWAMAGGDYYSRTTNWTAGVVPVGVSAVANFLERLTGPADVTISPAVVANTLNFRSAHSYTLTGRDSITLSGAIKARAAINVQMGDHTIEAPLALAVPLDITIGAGHSISLDGALDNSEAKAITKSGLGSLTISGRQTHGAGASLHIQQGSATLASDARGQLAITVGDNIDAASLAMDASQHLTSLRLWPASTASLTAGGQKLLAVDAWTLDRDDVGNWGATLNLADNGMLIRAGEDGWNVYHDVRAQILSARGNSTWTGKGITTSMADSLHTLGIFLNADGAWQPIVPSFMGEPAEAGAVLVRYTLAGDTDLNGTIDGDDYFRADSGFINAGWRWQDGDFDYDGLVSQADWLMMDQAWLRSHGGSPAASTSVPEPSIVCLVAAAALVMSRIRRPVPLPRPLPSRQLPQPAGRAGRP